MSKKTIPGFNPIKLGEAILGKRTKEDISFRVAASQSSIDMMALHRMEFGEETPSLKNYYLACKWLELPLDTFFPKPKTKKK